MAPPYSDAVICSLSRAISVSVVGLAGEGTEPVIEFVALAGEVGQALDESRQQLTLLDDLSLSLRRWPARSTR